MGYDLLICGSGIAGLRAAISAAQRSPGIRIAVISKVQVMRSHSVSAEGGTAAVLFEDAGDSIESHIYDTVKGSDFLADQDVAERLCRLMPEEIYRLEHWGMPWSRRKDGRVDQRAFGGYSFPRATYASDKVGFFEMQTLYDTCQKYDNIEYLNEWFVTSIIHDGQKFMGVTAIELSSGTFYGIKAKALIIATGGAGRLYSFSTYAHSSTPDGLDMAFRAGMALKDMEFVQFHPTGIMPSGILITEGARGEGGHLLNNQNERFMGRYAAKKMELAPRDIVSRSIMTEINEGRGFKHETGVDCMKLDLRHIGDEVIKEKLGGIREISIKFSGLDPSKDLLDVRPVCHYMMGGIHTDIDGRAEMHGVWAAGEAACNSAHGANRLGANSTSECIVWGNITGRMAADYAMQCRPSGSWPGHMVAEEEKRIYDGIFRGRGDANPYEVRQVPHRHDERQGVRIPQREGPDRGAADASLPAGERLEACGRLCQGVQHQLCQRDGTGLDVPGSGGGARGRHQQARVPGKPCQNRLSRAGRCQLFTPHACVPRSGACNGHASGRDN